MDGNIRRAYEVRLPLLERVADTLRKETAEYLAESSHAVQVTFRVMDAPTFEVRACRAGTDEAAIDPLTDITDQVSVEVVIPREANPALIEKRMTEAFTTVDGTWLPTERTGTLGYPVRQLICVIPPQVKPAGWSGRHDVPKTFTLRIFIKPLESTASPKADGRTSMDDSVQLSPCEAFHVVVLIHGIRTQAEWMAMVQHEIAVDDRIAVLPIKYGFFDSCRFWFPIWTRRQPITRVHTQIRAALQRYRKEHLEVKLSVIGHSFGTYIIGHLLREHFDLEIYRLILCGSVLPCDYPWEQIQGRFTPNYSVNECGHADIWPVLAQSTSWGYGASGTHGFGNVLIKDRHHAGGHGQYFDRDFVRTHWVPFIHNGIYTASSFELQAPPTPWWLSVLGILPLRWAIALSMLIFSMILFYLTANRWH